VFLVLALFLFYKTDLAVYVYTGFALLSILAINTAERIEFLKLICGKALWKIRLIENLAIAFPFSLFLLYKSEYIFAGSILLFGIATSFIPKIHQHSIRMRTPYFHRPFEFTIGFRKYILLLMFALFILIMAIKSKNMNLGLFSISIHFGIILSYLGFLEPSNFINIFNRTPNGFLKEKIKTVVLYTFLSIVPQALIQMIAFPKSVVPLIAIIGIGLCIAVYFIIVKYSNYPEVMSLPSTVLFMASIFIPILLIYTIPLFLRRSRQKLNHLLQ
jgi:hypothetical protein